jgi:hypothetical protein
VALARAGDHAAAAKLAGELAKAKEITPAALVELARIHALCTQSARAEPAVAERYAVLAEGLLGRAHAAGHFREAGARAAVREDEDFADLKKRDGFRKLVGP